MAKKQLKFETLTLKVSNFMLEKQLTIDISWQKTVENRLLKLAKFGAERQLKFETSRK